MNKKLYPGFYLLMKISVLLFIHYDVHYYFPLEKCINKRATCFNWMFGSHMKDVEKFP